MAVAHVEALRLLRDALGTKAVVTPGTVAGVPVVELRARGGQVVRFQALDATAPGPEPDAQLDIRYYQPLLLLRGASATRRQQLREVHSCFVDLAGAVHVDLPYLIVDRTDLRPLRRARGPEHLIDPFADRSSLVLRVLLSRDTRRGLGVREIASEAGVNPSTASRAVRELESAGLAQVERVARTFRVRIAEPATVFGSWTRRYAWEQNTRFTFRVPVGETERFLHRLPTELEGVRRWALTGESGIGLLLPHVFWSRFQVYVDVGAPQDVLDMARRKGWKRTDEGRLTLVVPSYPDSVWHGVRRIDGHPVVSTLQLALDAWAAGAPGHDHATTVLDRVLVPAWSGRAPQVNGKTILA